MNVIEDALLLLGKDDDRVLQILYKAVENEFLNYTNREDIPDEAESVLLQMLLIKFNQLGSEGIGSENFGGVSQSFEALPANLVPQLNRFRKIKLL